MSANPDVEEIVTLPVETNGHFVEVAPEVEPEPEPVATPAPQARTRRPRPSWAATAALGAAALLATGTLAYVGLAAGQQRDATQQRLVTTAATLAATDKELTQAKNDATAQTRRGDYASLVILDEGRVQWDYQNLQACHSYGACRTAGQDLLNDLQKFQTDRSSALIPSQLVNEDGSLGDALSAAIAADAEFIDGMDTFNVDKVTDGLQKLDAAMLSLAKAQVALGNQLK